MAKKTNTTPAKSPEKQHNLSVTVYDLKGTEVKTLDLTKDMFGIDYQPKLVAQYVRVYLANQRQGTASTKTRSEVIGSTKKIYRQKGTGNARHGSKKAPIFVGGGIAFGPKPTDHSLTMSKKQKQKALFSSLSQKAREGSIIAVVNEAMDMKPKTKEVAGLLKKLKLEKQKVLVVVPSMKENGFIMSARNLPNVELTQASTINPYMLINNKVAMFVEGAFNELENHFLKKHAN